MTIKEYLKDGVISDDFGIILKQGSHEDVANVTGWGKIQQIYPDHDEAMEFCRKLTQFIVSAINEKLERENKDDSE